MEIRASMELRAGGPGSGCNPAMGKCGRMVTLYHGTTEQNARKIVKEGFKSGKRSSWNKATSSVHGRGKIYFATQLEHAHDFGEETQAPKHRDDMIEQSELAGKKYGVLRADVPAEIYKKMRSDSENRSWKVFKGNIPAQYVTHASIYKIAKTGYGHKQVERLKGNLEKQERSERGW